MRSQPALIGVAHGTRNPAGQQTVRDLLQRVRAARPSLDARESYVDVQQPDLAASLSDVGASVVVPLLLSTGFHIRVDIAQAVQAHPEARSAPPLGPDPALAAVLADRLAQAGLREDDAVVVAGAGSSDPDGADNVTQTGKLLADMLGRDVAVGFVSAATPKIGDVVDQVREQHRGRVAVASYMLVHGVFHNALADTGADLISDPLGVDERIVELILRRYDEALSL